MLETSQSQSQSYGAREELHPVPLEARTIICPICEGVYAPSSAHSSFLLASDNALEAAFMSLCHFCFRCRRPACPQCWDEVHGICGDCVREAHLAFRTEVAPLEGLRFPPPRSEVAHRGEVTASLLSCVKPGRFVQEALSAPLSNAEAARTADGKIPTRVSEASQEIQGRYAGREAHRESGAMGRPGRKPQPVTDRVAVAKKPVRAIDSDEDEDEDAQEISRGRRVFRIVERVLTVVILVLLVAIIVLVALALYSNAVNGLVIQLVHVDIRAEVAYLVRLVQQLRG